MVLSDQNNSDQNITDQGNLKPKTPLPQISAERQQKVELLISLIKTQQQSLIVCGPAGIGKTKILKQLAKSNNKRQLWNYVECNESLTFGRLITHLSSVLSLRNEKSNGNKETNVAKVLAGQLNKISANGHTVMLILDDVGSLKAGIITKLYSFASKCKGLQLILSATPNALFIKRATDYIIDESYVVDIPPLSVQELETYLLEYLRDHQSLMREGSIDQNAISEIYHRSQGIPGLVVEELEKLQTESSGLSTEMSLAKLMRVALLVLFGLSIWAGLTYIRKYGNQQATVNYIDLDKAPPVVDTGQSVDAPDLDNSVSTNENKQEISVLPTTEDILNSTLADDAKALSNVDTNSLSTALPDNLPFDTNTIKNPSQARVTTVDDVSNQQQTTVEEPSQRQQNVEKTAQKLSMIEIHGPEWILLQDKENYTLQLMASHEQKVLQNYIDSISKLHDQFAYYQMKRDGKDWYGLIYGVYPTADAATVASKQLPDFIEQSFMLKINKVQERIRDFQ